MAIKATIKTKFGEERELYVRLNNVEVSNHGVKSRALFRGFLSKEAFDGGASYIHEELIEFNADVAVPLWGQAYDKLKEVYPDSADI